MSCPFCAALAAYGVIPAVARAHDRLRDELAVARMLASTPPAVLPSLGRLRAWRAARAHRVEPWRRVLDALAHGPLPLVLLDEDLNGPPVADRRAMRLRRERTSQVLKRLKARGLVVAVGWGVYAVPGKEEGMRDRDLGDARRLLADPRVAPPGLTVQEVADRLDVAASTVRGWLRKLRAGGTPIRVTHPPRAGRHGAGYSRYRIDPARGAA